MLLLSGGVHLAAQQIGEANVRLKLFRRQLDGATIALRRLGKLVLRFVPLARELLDRRVLGAGLTESLEMFPRQIVALQLHGQRHQQAAQVGAAFVLVQNGLEDEQGPLARPPGRRELLASQRATKVRPLVQVVLDEFEIAAEIARGQVEFALFLGTLGMPEQRAGDTVLLKSVHQPDASTHQNEGAQEEKEKLD